MGEEERWAFHPIIAREFPRWFLSVAEDKGHIADAVRRMLNVNISSLSPDTQQPLHFGLVVTGGLSTRWTQWLAHEFALLHGRGCQARFTILTSCEAFEAPMD